MDNNIRFPDDALYEDLNFNALAYLNAKGILLLNDFWGYVYAMRTKGKNRSLSEQFNEKNLIKQFRGMEMIFKKFDEYRASFPSMEGEILVGWTKLFIYSNPTNKRELLKKAKKYYRRYKWNTRTYSIGMPLNVCVNVFMKIFPLSISLAILITELYDLLFRLNIVSKSRNRA